MRRLLPLLLALLIAPFSARSATPDPLVMTYIKANADYWDLGVAIEKGFFAEEGFAPEYASNAGSAQSAQLLLTQAVQLAVVQPESLITAIVRGAHDLGGIAAPMRRVDWMLVAQKDITKPADLKGKSIGFSGLRVTEFWLTQRAMAEAGMPVGSYDTLQIGTSPAKFAALSKGSISAAILFEPTASQAVHSGYNRIDALGRYPGFIPGMYIVNRRWAAENDRGVRLARALQKAHDWLYNPANKAEAIAMLKKNSSTSEDAIEDVYQLYFVKEKFYTPDCAVDRSAITNAIQTLIEHHELDAKQAPALDEILLPASLGGKRF